MENNEIKWSDFSKINFRIGTIIEVKTFEKAIKPCYKIWVDFGPIGIKKTSAQITKNYSPSELLGQQIIGVINFPKKQIADFNSEFLLLGAINKEASNVIIIQPSLKVENGSIVS